MGSLARLLAAFSALIATAEQGPRQQSPPSAHVNPAPEAAVREGSLTELLGNAVSEVEEGVSQVVEEAGDAVEAFEEEVSGAVSGETDTDEFMGYGDGDYVEPRGENNEDTPGVHSFHITGGHPFIEYNGFIDKRLGRNSAQLDLHHGMQTLTEAKEWCAAREECVGFFHRGLADEGPFDMTFKDYWELNTDSYEQEPHTAYKKEARQAQAELASDLEEHHVTAEQAMAEHRPAGSQAADLRHSEDRKNAHEDSSDRLTDGEKNLESRLGGVAAEVRQSGPRLNAGLRGHGLLKHTTAASERIAKFEV